MGARPGSRPPTWRHSARCTAPWAGEFERAAEIAALDEGEVLGSLLVSATPAAIAAIATAGTGGTVGATVVGAALTGVDIASSKGIGLVTALEQAGVDIGDADAVEAALTKPVTGREILNDAVPYGIGDFLFGLLVGKMLDFSGE